MRNLLILCLILLTSLPAFSQAELDEPSAARKELTATRDRLVFELNHDNWINKPDNVKSKWFNRGINTYITYDIALSKGGNIGFSPGIGIGTNNVYHDAIITRDSVGVTYFEPIQDEVDYNNNKLTTAYVEVPLELRIRSNPDKNNNRYKLGLGLRGGYLLNAHSKYRGPDLSQSTTETVKVKNLRIPNINKYRLGATVRLGYGTFNLIGFYSLTSLFEVDRGPEIQQFSIGICFNSF